jgi:hypothetical protein
LDKQCVGSISAGAPRRHDQLLENVSRIGI